MVLNAVFKFKRMGDSQCYIFGFNEYNYLHEI